MMAFYVCSFICLCSSGFTGATCEVDIDSCADSPCVPGSQCIDQPDGFLCECAPGTRGALCDEVINPCENTRCSHGG